MPVNNQYNSNLDYLVNNQKALFDAITNMNNDSQKVVRDVYQKVNKFCDELDQSAKKDLETRIKDKLMQVAQQIKDLNPQQAKALLSDLSKLGVDIDKLEADLSSKGLTPQTSAVLKDITKQIDGMMKQLEQKIG
jgi:hypothetical protein